MAATDGWRAWRGGTLVGGRLVVCSVLFVQRVAIWMCRMMRAFDGCRGGRVCKVVMLRGPRGFVLVVWGCHGMRREGCVDSLSHHVGAGLERRLRCSGGGDVPSLDECAVGNLCKVVYRLYGMDAFPILKGRMAHFVGIYKEHFIFLCAQHHRPAFGVCRVSSAARRHEAFVASAGRL